MRFSHQNLRKLATYMLLVWVFALGAGVANACGVASSVAVSHHGGETASTSHMHAVVAEPHGHDDSQQLGKATCARFCDDNKVLTKSKAASDPSPALLVTSFPGLGLHAPPALDRLSFISGDIQDRSRRPALPVTVVRLTL